MSAQLLSEFAESGRYIIVRSHRATFGLLDVLGRRRARASYEKA
jgi:hypothetical protein